MSSASRAPAMSAVRDRAIIGAGKLDPTIREATRSVQQLLAEDFGQRVLMASCASYSLTCKHHASLSTGHAGDDSTKQ